MICRIDTRRDVATTFGVVSGEKNKWQGGILSHDGKIYAIPSNAKHILYIDTSTNPCETTGGESDFSESETKYSLVGDLPGTKDKWQGKKSFTLCFYNNHEKLFSDLIKPNFFSSHTIFIRRLCWD